MQAHQLSSGDIIADRRADYARMLDEGGEPASAAELMEQALEIAPVWAAGWFRLAEYREKAGNGEGAIAALDRVRGLDPEDMFGAALKLALLGGIAVPEQPPTAYVERLFDDYAGHFDQALVERLDYSVPKKLSDVIRRTLGKNCRFALAVDLGCGTGLFGEEIRDCVERLEGFDLSANMLAKAEEKRVYDLLEQADLSVGPDDCGLFSEDLPRHRAGLVSAADVLMYLGNLENFFSLAAEISAPGAIVAFSVEDAGAGEGFRLLESLRYAHSETYLKSLCAANGLHILALEKTVIRMDAGEPVHGILIVSEKSA
jgi:predicted TPR repeat methyltransferase